MKLMEKRKENIKSIILVVLFLLTVLLLYIFWSDMSLEEIKLPSWSLEQQEEPLSAKTVTLPEQIVVDFNNDAFASVSPAQNGIWDQLLSIVNEFALDPELKMESVETEKYQEVKKFRSVRFSFDYQITLTDFCDICGIAKADGFSAVGAFDNILLSEGSPENLFFVNTDNKTCYRLESSKYENHAAEIIDGVETAGYDPYYQLGTLAGTEDTTIIPLTFYTAMKKVPCLQEDTGKERAFAERFFGGSLDFIRTVTEDNGTTIYMYGYGQTVLTLRPDGSAEYKAEAGSNGVMQGYLQALTAALEFVSAHGGWLTEENGGRTPFVKTVEVTESNKKRAYQFVFGFREGKAEICYEEGDCLMIEVVNGDVTYYNRDMIEVEKLAPEEGAAGQEAYSAINTLAQNYGEAVRVLEREGYAIHETEADKELLFNQFIALVDRMEAGYLRQTNGSRMELCPVWIVSVADITFYYGLFDARYIGYEKHTR